MRILRVCGCLPCDSPSVRAVDERDPTQRLQISSPPRPSTMSLQERFEQATIDVKKLNKCDNSEKLEFYGLFKQAKGETFDPKSKPSAFAFEAKYKHQAWEKVSHLSVEEAQEQYIELFEKLKAKYGLSDE
ncbi:hypothetical protein EYB26_003553 [Talaromyces marneffei]|nr:uncharacterized protein EYB26_003553 [Talaromyces marneffei]QGA15892.1 hypothetical protein EYB26_003553 [Talaromyces marneffei]